MTPCHATRARGAGLIPRRAALVASTIFVALLATGCSTNKGAVGASKLPQPRQVIVYDFASSLVEVSPDSTFAGKFAAPAPPPTVEQLALAKQIGSKIAAQLVGELKTMGIPATHAIVGLQPRLNDIVLRGYVVSSDGDLGPSSVLGLSSASPNFGAALEGFQMTPYGLNRLGSGATSDPIGLVFSNGARLSAQGGDGSQVDARAREIALEIAALLKPRFQQQGWIP
jgi:hypothetical protein